jgi:hypothetical protein
MDNKLILALLVSFIFTAIAELGGIVFTTKHTDTETKISIETPIKSQAEDAPKPSW